MKTRRKKQNLSYTAIFEPNEQGGYCVSFPAFPGCVTFGNTFEESLDMAKEALSLWLEELEASREPIPKPSGRPIITEISISPVTV